MPRLTASLAALVLAGCAHRAPVAHPAVLDKQAVAEAALSTLTIELAFEGETLDAETRASLQRLAAVLHERPAVKVLLDGDAPGTRFAVRAPGPRSLAYGDGFAGTRKRRAVPAEDGATLVKLTVRPPEPRLPTGLEQAVSRAP